MTSYELGVEGAKRHGSWIFDCPFCAKTERQDYDEWMRGFRDERDRQEKLGDV